MRFVTFVGDGGRPTSGVVRGEQVLDLSHAACSDALGGVVPSVLEMVQQGLASWAARIADALPDHHHVIAGLTRNPSGSGDTPAWIPGQARDDVGGRDDASSAAAEAGAWKPLADLRLLAPLRPGKVIGAAFNFTDALAERGMAHPKEPVTFVRSGRTVIGPGDDILLPPDVGNVTYEAELAVVIGRRALRVSPERAMDYIAGYTAHNDVSGTDLVKGDGGNFVRGKNMPASSPLGPWLSTIDEVKDPYAVRIRLDVDGRPLQNGSTATMLYRIAELISYASCRMPLDPGDVIATGTPPGVAPSHNPPAWLAPGQTVTVEVEGFGRLTNPVRRGEPFVEH